MATPKSQPSRPVPKDRLPKQTKQQAAAPALPPPADLSVERAVVSVGVDFRPLPVDIGDGKIWLFQPDPSTEDWSLFLSALEAAGAEAESLDEEEMTTEQIVEKMEELSARTRAGVAAIMLEESAAEFMESTYSLAVLQRLAAVVTRAIMGVPTEGS